MLQLEVTELERQVCKINKINNYSDGDDSINDLLKSSSDDDGADDDQDGGDDVDEKGDTLVMEWELGEEFGVNEENISVEDNEEWMGENL